MNQKVKDPEKDKRPSKKKAVVRTSETNLDLDTKSSTLTPGQEKADQSKNYVRITDDSGLPSLEPITKIHPDSELPALSNTTINKFNTPHAEVIKKPSSNKARRTEDSKKRIFITDDSGLPSLEPITKIHPDSELPELSNTINFIEESPKKLLLKNYLATFSGKDIKDKDKNSATERRKKTDLRRNASGLKLVKLYLDEDVVNQIHTRMVGEGYNDGRIYKKSRSVNQEDISEFITHIFNNYSKSKPNPNTSVETHLRKLTTVATHLSIELTVTGIALFMNLLGYKKPKYLTNNTIEIDVEGEFPETVLDVSLDKYNQAWEEKDIEMLFDEEKIKKILRLMP